MESSKTEQQEEVDTNLLTKSLVKMSTKVTVEDSCGQRHTTVTYPHKHDPINAIMAL